MRRSALVLAVAGVLLTGGSATSGTPEQWVTRPSYRSCLSHAGGDTRSVEAYANTADRQRATVCENDRSVGANWWKYCRARSPARLSAASRARTAIALAFVQPASTFECARDNRTCAAWSGAGAVSFARSPRLSEFKASTFEQAAAISPRYGGSP